MGKGSVGKMHPHNSIRRLYVFRSSNYDILHICDDRKTGNNLLLKKAAKEGILIRKGVKRTMLFKRVKSINMKRGSGTFLLGTLFAMLAIFLAILLVEYSNGMYGEVLAVSRGDMIADSAAIYAQSYDYNYNQNHAREMVNLLTDLNNSVAGDYEFSTSIAFPSNDVLSLQCTTKVPSTYNDITQTDFYYITHTSSVRSVDIYGDVFVIPEP